MNADARGLHQPEEQHTSCRREEAPRLHHRAARAACTHAASVGEDRQKSRSNRSLRPEPECPALQYYSCTGRSRKCTAGSGIPDAIRIPVSSPAPVTPRSMAALRLTAISVCSGVRAGHSGRIPLPICPAKPDELSRNPASRAVVLQSRQGGLRDAGLHAILDTSSRSGPEPMVTAANLRVTACIRGRCAPIAAVSWPFSGPEFRSRPVWNIAALFCPIPKSHS